MSEKSWVLTWQVPAADEFSGSVPNEVSPHAQNNLFTYRYLDGASVLNNSISLTTGIRSLAVLSAEIETGLTAAGHQGAFRLSANSAGYIVVEVRGNGFQALFSKTVSVAKYLGVPQRDFPCHPV